jgi:hypothetical protein
MQVTPRSVPEDAIGARARDKCFHSFQIEVGEIEPEDLAIQRYQRAVTNTLILSEVTHLTAPGRSGYQYDRQAVLDDSSAEGDVS